MKWLVLLACSIGSPLSAWECPKHVDPIVTLEYPSPYDSKDASRSTIDVSSQLRMMQRLAPVDDLLRSLSRVADQIGTEDNPRAVRCLERHLTAWAAQDALSDLRNDQVKRTVGARLVGFAALHWRKGEGTSSQTVVDWLSRRAREQMSYWDAQATKPISKGNLAAWAALAVFWTGLINEDPEQIEWARASFGRVLCSAHPDGSLPQEMRRGKFALHYQLHALSALVTAVALDKRAYVREYKIPCKNRLLAIANFALEDLEKGHRTQAISGHIQSYFDGTETLETHELAWIEALHWIYPDAKKLNLSNDLRPFRNSKLGGDQTEIWGAINLVN